MMTLQLDITQYTSKSKRVPDREYEEKKLLIPEFLQLINRDIKQPYKPLTEMQLKIRMWDAGYTTAQSWYELLAEMKQAKSPGACWGANTKRK
jgi:hypothetical protein